MENHEAPVESLVVDANAFLRNVKLERLGKTIFTIPEVVDEIRDVNTRQRLQVLPYEVHFLQPTPESVKKVTEFSKKTGDFPSLSAVDLKLLALVYKLEAQKCGVEHLKCQPNIQVSQKVSSYRPQAIDPRSLVGFHIPKTSIQSSTATPNNSASHSTCDLQHLAHKNVEILEKLAISEFPTTERPEEEAFKDKNIEVESSEESSESSGSSASESDGDASEELSEGESDWITPANLDAALVKMGGNLKVLEPEKNDQVPVACLTTDFAMQNVLLHMGLKVVSVDGMLVRKLKTYILKCHSCFKPTSVMTKKFCPCCGNPTLDKVAVSVNPDDGTIQYHLSSRKKVNTKGLRYSLPAPKGGKHACNPILCEDQPVPENRMSRRMADLVNPMDPEYTARESPFATKDVTSRSAMLGVRSLGRHGKGQNTNACKAGKKRGGKKR